jgi:hypothetical protein
MSAGLDAHLGLLPAPAIGLRGGVGMSYSRVAAAVEGGLLPGADEGDTARFRAFWFRARGCAALHDSDRLLVAPCAGIELDVLHGQGIEVPAPRSATAAWFAPMLGARVGLRAWSWLWVILGVDGKLPLERPEFEVGGVHVFRPAPVHGAASVEVGVRL